MKISGWEIFPVSIPYRNQYSISRGSADAGRHIVLRIDTDEGIAGWGEAALFLPDRGETPETVITILERYLLPRLVGIDPFDINTVIAKCDEISFSRGYQFMYSICAIDNALYDIMGKAAGVPVHKLLGGAIRTQLSVTRSLSIGSPDQMGQAALTLREAGYRMLTVKIGYDPAVDLARVQAVREALGSGFPIEVDVNQGYTADVAIPILKKMERFEITGIEQPCPWWDLEGMAKVAGALDTPVIADESAQTLPDVMRIIRMAAADVICIKMARGGISHAQKVATVAQAAGLPCTMGSNHTFGIGTAAIGHFAAATGAVSDYIGYGNMQERSVDDIIVGQIPFIKGVVSVLSGPGLGVEVDLDKLERYRDRAMRS